MRSSNPNPERRPAPSPARAISRGIVLTALAAIMLVAAAVAQAATPAIAESGDLPNITVNPPSVDLETCAKGDPACGAKLNIELEGAIKSPEPKCVGFPNFNDPADCPFQTLGAFSVELRYDPSLISVTATPGALLSRPGVTCMTMPTPGVYTFGCVTKGKPDAPSGPGTLASIHVTPAGTLSQKSVTLPLLTMRCKLADLQGHGIPFGACDDASITLHEAPDTDHDGCADSEEKGNNPSLGGRRDDHNFWDFFDTPAAGGRNKAVTVEDIAGVVGRFGSTGSPAGNPMTAPPPSPAYHTAFDRQDDPSTNDAWRLLGPDGVIAVNDIVASVAQFGDNCTAAP
jgi:hypothetical protein